MGEIEQNSVFSHLDGLEVTCPGLVWGLMGSGSKLCVLLLWLLLCVPLAGPRGPLFGHAPAWRQLCWCLCRYDQHSQPLDFK